MGSSDHLSVYRIWCLCPIYWHHLPFSAPFWSLLLPHLMDTRGLFSCASAKIYFSASLSWYPPLSTATTGPVSAPCPRTPSTTCRLWIWDGGTLTVTPLLGAFQCMNVCTDYLLPIEWSWTLPASSFHPVASLPVSPSPAAKHLCGPPQSASPWPLKISTSPPRTVALPVPPLYKKPQNKELYGKKCILLI